jgi:hypothetical protein
MKLFKVWQNKNDSSTYDSAVVVAATVADAQKIVPGHDPRCWVPPAQVKVEHIGTAKAGLKAGTVICASFNAG